ncbi:MAG: hypothetical protein CVV37_07990 [Nitrospira bacterium HGW-Nitrospira-1]|nr:MAG: hypothetical protein CVV37_07990 [Nitrospira bacterium HGW-Nitrospira-1]
MDSPVKPWNDEGGSGNDGGGSCNDMICDKNDPHSYTMSHNYFLSDVNIILHYQNQGQIPCLFFGVLKALDFIQIKSL